jgi:hypothetical protein
MKKNYNGDSNLSKVTSANLKIYSLDGVRLDLSRTLDSYCIFSADRTEPFKFIIDFEDVIIIRLLGGDYFIFVPMNDFKELKTTKNLKDQID